MKDEPLSHTCLHARIDEALLAHGLQPKSDMKARTTARARGAVRMISQIGRSLLQRTPSKLHGIQTSSSDDGPSFRILLGAVQVPIEVEPPSNFCH